MEQRRPKAEAEETKQSNQGIDFDFIFSIVIP